MYFEQGSSRACMGLTEYSVRLTTINGGTELCPRKVGGAEG
jgi:hypothetical protein